MSKTSYSNNKDSLLKRLNRIEGQIRGISRLVAQDTYCIDVITQISAAQAALDKVALELLRDHAKGCLQPADSAQKTDNNATEKLADELVRVIGLLL